MKTMQYNSYAKINLFLHILNKRADNYHNLQTWFTFVDLKDELIFSFNDSQCIDISSNQAVGFQEDNLIYKAINVFQNNYNIDTIGVDVALTKNIPMGAGLGGGSSNAATTLMAMRDYYRPDVSNADMLPLAAKLGADVPIFLYGESAWAEGIGDILHPKKFKEQYALLVKPNIHVSTKEFFTSDKLIKFKQQLSKDMNYNAKLMTNTFEEVFYGKYPLFKEYIKSVDDNFRMTGTGSCFFLLSQDEQKLIELARKIDKTLDKWVVKTLNYAY